MTGVKGSPFGVLADMPTGVTVRSHLGNCLHRESQRCCHVVNRTITDRTPMTAEEALAALKTGDPIHVQGEEMRRFIAVIDSRR